MPEDYAPAVDQDGTWSLTEGEGESAITVQATPLFESPVRVGFVSIRIQRADGSILEPDRLNLGSRLARKRYLNVLAEKGIALPEAVLVALSVVVVDAHNLYVKRKRGNAFEHSNTPSEPPSQAPEELAAEAADLLECTDVLAKVGSTATARGYAGDTHPVRLVYAAFVTRSLRRPMNLAVVSPSAAGKNATVDAARELHPPEAVIEIKAGSARAIVYSDYDYEHRVVLFAEADSIPDQGPAATAVRTLAADNYLAYDVVELDAEDNKWRTRHIVKPGPTGLVTTSTKSLAEQLSTRVLELGLSDNEQQTRDVMHAHARRSEPDAAPLPDLAPWHAYGRYVAQRAQELAGIRIPFGHVLADLVPARAVRMRRDFAQLLMAIQANALLHIQHRAIDAGWLVATIGEDYAAARELLAPLFDTLAAGGLTPAIRATVLAIEPAETNVSQAVIAQRLELSRSTVSWRVRRALEGGWLVDDGPSQSQDGLPHSRVRRLRRGEPLPEDTSALPTVERLFECSNADPRTYKTQHTTSSAAAPRTEGETPGNGTAARPVLRPWQPAGSDWEVVPEDAIGPPGLEYRLGLGVDGQKSARWPTASTATSPIEIVFDEDDGAEA